MQQTVATSIFNIDYDTDTGTPQATSVPLSMSELKSDALMK